MCRQQHEIEQMVANVFPDEFPLYPEDWPGEPSGVRCVGDHVPESLVAMACEEIQQLRKQVRDLTGKAGT